VTRSLAITAFLRYLHLHRHQHRRRQGKRLRHLRRQTPTATYVGTYVGTYTDVGREVAVGTYTYAASQGKYGWENINSIYSHPDLPPGVLEKSEAINPAMQLAMRAISNAHGGPDSSGQGLRPL
jgi:hypothetical protein